MSSSALLYILWLIFVFRMVFVAVVSQIENFVNGCYGNLLSSRCSSGFALVLLFLTLPVNARGTGVGKGRRFGHVRCLFGKFIVTSFTLVFLYLLAILCTCIRISLHWNRSVVSFIEWSCSAGFLVLERFLLMWWVSCDMWSFFVALVSFLAVRFQSVSRHLFLLAFVDLNLNAWFNGCTGWKFIAFVSCQWAS